MDCKKDGACGLVLSDPCRLILWLTCNTNLYPPQIHLRVFSLMVSMRDPNCEITHPATQEESDEIVRATGEPEPGMNPVIFSLPNNVKKRVDMTLDQIRDWHAFQKVIVPLKMIKPQSLWVHWSSLRAKFMLDKYDEENITRVKHTQKGRKYIGLLFKLKEFDIPSTILVDTTQFNEHAFY
jgi:hypothetical protein